MANFLTILFEGFTAKELWHDFTRPQLNEVGLGQH